MGVVERRGVETAVGEPIVRVKRVLEPPKGRAALHLEELWEYRELLYFLTWRDIKVRYKQAVLGVLWAVLNPVITVVVFDVVFNKLLHVKQPTVGNVPYILVTYAALLPWNLFSGALGRAGMSLVGNANLLTKIYFPRLVIPISAVVGGLVDFAISLVVYFCLMAAYGVAPSWHIVFLPFFTLLALITALAFGLWLAALNVLYRDVQYIIPFLIQLWMFLSPVAYILNLKGAWALVYGLNPLVGVIEGFRWALAGQAAPGWLFLVSNSAMVVLLVTGLMYFKRMERTFADLI
jgi:lipopolysaccharide transport system permease protein